MFNPDENPRNSCEGCPDAFPIPAPSPPGVRRTPPRGGLPKARMAVGGDHRSVEAGTAHLHESFPSFPRGAFARSRLFATLFGYEKGSSGSTECASDPDIRAVDRSAASDTSIPCSARMEPRTIPRIGNDSAEPLISECVQ